MFPISLPGSSFKVIPHIIPLLLLIESSIFLRKSLASSIDLVLSLSIYFITSSLERRFKISSASFDVILRNKSLSVCISGKGEKLGQSIFQEIKIQNRYF